VGWQRGWHRFYSAISTLIARFAMRPRMTLGAPRHLTIGYILNRLNHHKLGGHIPDITVSALSNKAPGFVMNASDCSPKVGNAHQHGFVAVQSTVRHYVAAAIAHKSALQSFSGFLWLKTRIQRES
jgi:hypothetical protein